LELSKLAHAGLFVMVKFRLSPSASETVGLNEYGCPTLAEVTGVPLITGARFGGSTVPEDLTAIEKAGRDTVVVPSDTAMTMLEWVPTCVDVGVPRNLPVDVLNVAHAGLLVMRNVRAWPSGSDAVGVNEKVWPTTTEADGVPPITGGLFAAEAVIEKAGNEREIRPSLTEMIKPLQVRARGGVPLSLPVVLLNVAQVGFQLMRNVSACLSGSDAVGVKL
jgi:hypothetical protein